MVRYHGLFQIFNPKLQSIILLFCEHLATDFYHESNLLDSSYILCFQPVHGMDIHIST